MQILIAVRALAVGGAPLLVMACVQAACRHLIGQVAAENHARQPTDDVGTARTGVCVPLVNATIQFRSNRSRYYPLLEVNQTSDPGYRQQAVTNGQGFADTQNVKITTEMHRPKTWQQRAFIDLKSSGG